MFRNKIELCDNLTAIFNEDRNMYLVKISWLGREIPVYLSTGFYDEDDEVEGLIKAFELFYEKKSELLKKSQNDIKELLLPYIATHEPKEGYLSFPKVTLDDFDAEYWLIEVAVLGGSDLDSDVDFYFDKLDNKEASDEMLSVYRNIDGDYLDFYAGLANVTQEDLGL